MSIIDLIRKRKTMKPANANPAKVANDEQKGGEPLAELATLALANQLEPADSSLTDKRIRKVVTKLERDNGLRYTMETHSDIDPDMVILTVAIQGKGACELRIPKSRYEAFAILELIEKHTNRETLQ